MATILQTTRLRLRELTTADLDFVAAMLGDPEVMRYYPRCYDRSESAAWIERQLVRYARDGHGLWLVEDRMTAAPLGQVGLIRQTVGGDEATEIGYLIDRPQWRQGFATEAAAACRDHAFGALGRDRVISLIRPENTPSQRVARKIGMRPENRVVTHGIGGFDHLVFAIKRPRVAIRIESAGGMP